MDNQFVNLTLDNIENEHICCAISDKKHQDGVNVKKEWIKERIKEGHVFRKLDAKGKVFIEYAPLETAWVPIEGDNYLYIYCLWVSGSFKKKGYGNSLLEYCIEDAKKRNKSGVCILSSKKKKPFLSDRKFLEKYGFKMVDSIGDYQLLSLSFDNSDTPKFTDNVRKGTIDDKKLTIYYGKQCPFIPNCIKEISNFCKGNNLDINFVEIDTLQKAKSVPCIFNNWAVFKDGKFETVHLLNESQLKKALSV